MKKFLLLTLLVAALSLTSCASIVAQFRNPDESTIRIGMTESELESSIGIPISKNRTMSNGMIYVQYVYRNNVYVYTENGIVTAWQD
jgi:hypothetical protein